MHVAQSLRAAFFLLLAALFPFRFALGLGNYAIAEFASLFFLLFIFAVLLFAAFLRISTVLCFLSFLIHHLLH